MRIAILGGPGSGKGTQAKMLAQRYRVPQISTGDLLREAVNSNEDLAEKVRAAMASGNLVDNGIVEKLLEERLRKRDAKRGFIIDGYPRNIPQAQSLDALLGMLGRSLQIAINVDVEDSALVKRVTGRSSCAKCGAIYNKYYSPPKVKNTCDNCGNSEFVSREDDTVKTVKVRIAVYNEETAPLIIYYRAQHKLRTVNGMGDMDIIHQKVCDIIDLEIRPLEVKTLEFAADTNEEVESTIIAGGQISRVEIEKKKRPVRKKKKTIITKSAAKVTKKKTITKKKVTKKKPAARAQTKKPVAKKSASKKIPVVRKTVAKKSTAKKIAKKKVTPKKVVIKKAGAKKMVTKKMAKQVAQKKKVVKKAIVKKTPVKKKTVTKKKVTKKKPAARAQTKKPVAKKSASKKIPIVRKTAAKKSTAKKIAKKKVTPKKVVSKKAGAKKMGTKKVAKQAAQKKKVVKKAIVKKTPVKKKPLRKKKATTKEKVSKKKSVRRKTR